MAAQMDNGVNKERVLNDLLKIAKKSGMITAKDLDSAVKMLELDKEQQTKMYTALEGMGVTIVGKSDSAATPAAEKEPAAEPAAAKQPRAEAPKKAAAKTRTTDAKAKTEAAAKTVAKSVICSSLTKAAMFGADANWGRVLCAIGYSGAKGNVEQIDVAFRSPKGTIEVGRNGAGVECSEEIAKEILLEKEIEIIDALNDGEFDRTAWGCDLTYDYVKINGDYRT